MEAYTLSYIFDKLNTLGQSASLDTFIEIFGHEVGGHVCAKFGTVQSDWVALWADMDEEYRQTLTDWLTKKMEPEPYKTTLDQMTPAMADDRKPRDLDYGRVEEWAGAQGWSIEGEGNYDDAAEAYIEAVFIVEHKHEDKVHSVGPDWFFDNLSEEEREGPMALQARDNCETADWSVRRIA